MNKKNRAFATILTLAAAAALLLAGCQNGYVGENSNAKGTIVFNVPRLSSVIEKNRNGSTKAYLTADRVELELRDSGGTLIDSNTITGSNSGSWDVPPGNDYTLLAFVYNESSVSSAQHTVDGSFGPFSIGPSEAVSATIMAFPNSPVGLVDETPSAMFTEDTGGEQWFTFTTGPGAISLYVDVFAFAGSNADSPQVDADFDLYVFGSDGLIIDSAATFSDDNLATGDFDSLRVEDTITVQPNETYYVGVRAWRGGDFEVYFDADPLVEGFESGSIAWNTFDTINGASVPVWQATSADSNTGAYSAAIDTYQDDTIAELLTPNIALSSTATNITLSFFELYETESGWDFAEIWVRSYDRPAGSDWVLLSSRSGTNSLWPSWQQTNLSLLQFAGETIYVDFKFTSDGSFSGYTGWFIDDVQIIVTP